MCCRGGSAGEVCDPRESLLEVIIPLAGLLMLCHRSDEVILYGGIAVPTQARRAGSGQL